MFHKFKSEIMCGSSDVSFCLIAASGEVMVELLSEF